MRGFTSISKIGRVQITWVVLVLSGIEPSAWAYRYANPRGSSRTIASQPPSAPPASAPVVSPMTSPTTPLMPSQPPSQVQNPYSPQVQNPPPPSTLARQPAQVQAPPQQELQAQPNTAMPPPPGGGIPQPGPGSPNPSSPNGGPAPGDPNQPPPAGAPTDGSSPPAPEEKADKSEEEDFSSTPFTRYGEFSSNDEEESDSKFFQYGRFFGVSLGLGAQMVDGNRGSLWQGGFPMVDVKLHYWFDFQMALDLGLYTAQHYYDTPVLGQGHVDVNWLHFGIDLKYYILTKDLSAAVSFASPYLIAGFGSYSKTEKVPAQALNDTTTSIGLTLGVGLEFVISPHKTYFEVEGKWHTVTFQDTYYTTYASAGIPNLTGYFYTVSGSVLFTW